MEILTRSGLSLAAFADHHPAVSDERNLFAALAVLLSSYALVGLIAFSARGEPVFAKLRRYWRARRDAQRTDTKA